MVYKRFNLYLIVRVIILFVTCIWLSEALRSPYRIYTMVVIIILLAMQVYGIIRSVNRMNRDITSFFSGIEEIGSSVKPNFKVESRSSRKLVMEVTRVSDMVRSSRIDTERQLRYIEFLLDNVPAGLIVTDSKKSILSVNKAAAGILKRTDLADIAALDRVSAGLGKQIDDMNAGDRKVIRINIDNEVLHLLARVSEFSSGEEKLKIVSLQNVVNELQENELLSWQRLTRVLTHEIMNSLTPISSLILATKKCLSIEGNSKTTKTIDDESIRDALLNLSLVEERSAGINNFVKNFRRVTNLPKLNLESTDINDLIKGTIRLYKKQLDEKKVKINFIPSPDIEKIEMDKNLIEQVLINLLKNSVESIDESSRGEIVIRTLSKDGRVVVQLSDNGKGIPDEIIDNIFMPFFTTKKDGTGVGLNIARQIMRLHNGSVSVRSEPGTETCFSLLF